MVSLSHSGMAAIEGCAYRLILQTRANPDETAQSFAGPDTHWLNTITGHAIHLAIAEFIERWRQDPSLEPDAQLLSEDAMVVIDQIWDERDTRILEYLHGVEIDEDRDYRREHLRKVSNLCIMFCRIWDQMGLQEMTYISHERRDSAPFNGEIYIIGYIDLLVADENDTYLVLDWKSGFAPEKVLGLSQLGIYAFLTHHLHGVDYSDIRCGFASLATGTCRLREFTERDLKLLSRRVQDVVDTLAVYDTGEFEDSEWAAPTQQDCISCPYSGQCEFSYI